MSQTPLPSPTIVVVGSLNMDFVVSVKRLPGPGETVLGSHFTMIPGGKGANQAVAAGRLGGASVRVKMLGRVGQDVFADHLKSSLTAAGVDVSGIQTTPAQPTGCALIAVEESGQNSIVVASGANFQVSVEDIEAACAGSGCGAFQGASAVLFQLETPLPAIQAALRRARNAGAITILDPAPAQELSDAFLAEVDILTPNENEALKLLNLQGDAISPAEAPRIAAALMNRGPRTVILKLGREGCFVKQAGSEGFVQGFVVDAVDTTAAGDTFNAALAIALALGASMTQAARFANAAAAISVTRLGAQPSAPTRIEVEAFLQARQIGFF